ncbi:MAG: zinc-binding dehydrogenase [Anaerolineales bacterium]|nr:zinc-binding dehydrogenase [Anaerolineales bacterium]
MQSENVFNPNETAGLSADYDELQTAAVALLRAVKLIQIELGETVLVSGNGPVGQAVAQLARIAGAGRVIGLTDDGSVQTDDTQVVWMTDLGKVAEHLPQGQADLLIETSGNPAQLEKLLACVRGGGRILLVGSIAGSANFDFYPHLHRRSLTLKSVTLQAALAETGDDRLKDERESNFVSHLLRSGQLNMPDHLITNPMAGEPLLPVSSAS